MAAASLVSSSERLASQHRRVIVNGDDGESSLSIRRASAPAGDRSLMVMGHGAPPSSADVRVSAGQSSGDRSGGEGAADVVDVPEPQGAELLTHFLPLGRATLEEALDQVLGQFEGLGAELPELRQPVGWFSASMALIGAALAAEMSVRLIRRSSEEDSRAVEGDGEKGMVRFPGLPGHWSLEES